ncbi:MAG: rRNA maturation RNase YbeY [Gemmatimonadetes bacterium]|nr:rRNA maturation RNase YbeY [Gemmatimonadota bacterium]
MNIEIETVLPAPDIPREALWSAVSRILRGEGRDRAAVTVVLVDDPYIRKLNHKYRHLDRATDVLSFGMDDDPGSEGETLGDVYVSVDRAREQAERYHVSLDDELQRLVVHGCLHLLGYDHQNASQRKVMREKERVYSADAAARVDQAGQADLAERVVPADRADRAELVTQAARGIPEGQVGEKCCG